MPLLNNMQAIGDATGYRRTFWSAVAVNATTALLVASVLAVAAERLLHIFGKEFRGHRAWSSFCCSAP